MTVLLIIYGFVYRGVLESPELVEAQNSKHTKLSLDDLLSLFKDFDC